MILSEKSATFRDHALRSRLTDAGQQPPHYLPVRIATGRDSLHRLLSEGLGLLFGLSLVLRKRHPFADDFSPRLVFRLHAQSFALNGGRRQRKGRARCFRSLSTALDDLARASFPAHMGRASSCPNALAD